jgi:tetraacyldisaccharide 4'-kinase
MKLLRNISFPFVPVYYAVTWTRNKLYDFGIKTSKSYNIPIICVGNLSVGGTGKTPMIEYLIRLLKDNHKVATLSRGYKRKTSGFQIANKDSSAETLGDEPFQFCKKFKNEIIVAVDTNRQNGIESIQTCDDSVDVVLLDDAFQHRKVKAGLNILLTTYNNLYVDDLVLPTGNLREPKSGAERANIIIVTKCPETLSDKQKGEIIQKLNTKAEQKVFFSSIKYSDFIINEL